MTDKEEIRNIIELFIAWNGETNIIDVANIDSAVEFIANSMQEEPIFKVGDTIQKKDNNSIRYSIINKTSDGYRALRGLSDTIIIWFSEQDQWELVKEPVSKDLEEAAYHNCIDRLSKESIEDFKAGAKWQKEKDDEEKVLTYKHGFKDCKEQMMTKAIDGKVIANGMGNPILHLWDKGRHLIDKKVKVIVIKED